MGAHVPLRAPHLARHSRRHVPAAQLCLVRKRSGWDTLGPLHVSRYYDREHCAFHVGLHVGDERRACPVRRKAAWGGGYVASEEVGGKVDLATSHAVIFTARWGSHGYNKHAPEFRLVYIQMRYGPTLDKSPTQWPHMSVI